MRAVREQIEQRLNADFPKGMRRERALEILGRVYRVPAKRIDVVRVERSPIVAVRGESSVEIHSWVTARIREYRSWRSLMLRNYVGAQMKFDQDDRLIFIDVILTKGPEL